VSVSVAECDTTASSGGSECDTASSSACGAECYGVASSAAARESVAADHAFRLVLDASPDGLPVLVGQRLPRCEQQRVLPSGRVEPRLFRREQPERAHVCGLLDASNNREQLVRHDEHRDVLRAVPVSVAASAAAAAAAFATIALAPSSVTVAASAVASTIGASPDAASISASTHPASASTTGYAPSSASTSALSASALALTAPAQSTVVSPSS